VTITLPHYWPPKCSCSSIQVVMNYGKQKEDNLDFFTFDGISETS
jgi:hypothetical protein